MNTLNQKTVLITCGNATAIKQVPAELEVIAQADRVIVNPVRS